MHKRYTLAYLILFTLIVVFLATVARVSAKETINTPAYIFIGDNRTIGMDKAVRLCKMDDTFVVAESKAGYDWFIETGSSMVDEIRDSHPEYKKWIYIFNLGVNDLENVDKYIDLYKTLSIDATVYYLSVNPTDDLVTSIQCSDIEEFNSKIYHESYNNFIDSYSYLSKVSGFNLDIKEDGINYSNRTYIKLYDFVKLAIDVRQFVEKNNGRYSAYFYLYNKQ